MAPENLSGAALEEALAALPAWDISGHMLVRTFVFGSFGEAIAFVDRVAVVAGELDHHPDIDIRYRHVRIACWTHVTGGVTHRDIRLAERVEALANG